MQFTKEAISQAEAMVSGLVEGQGSLFRIDLDSPAAVQDLFVMLLVGAKAQRMVAGLAIGFFIVDPAHLGVDVDDGSLALVGPGVAPVDEVADDLEAAVTGAALAGCLLSAEDEAVHLVAQGANSDEVFGFVLSGESVHRTSLDPDSPLLQALRSGLATHGADRPSSRDN